MWGGGRTYSEANEAGTLGPLTYTGPLYGPGRGPK